MRGVLPLVINLVVAAGAATQPAIDWPKAQQLLGRWQRGETLTPDERAYLDRAREARQRGAGPVRGPVQPPATQRATTGLIPLDQMSGDARYRGEDGGLYGAGRNTPPAAHQEAAARELARIVPLDAEGRPADDGHIVLLAIGMSNTTQEFSRFKIEADRDPAKSPRVVIVDGAQGGQDSAAWNRKEAPPWTVAEQRLKAAGVKPGQVQAVWLKQARIQPARLGDFPAHAQALKTDLVAILNLARERYPNLRIAYFSSRIYAGYATTPLNPEPYAYESAFAVRWVIQDQIKGDAALNFDPARGPVKAPLVLWGPYLWGDGVTPRKSDGLVWTRDDLGPDGTHPSPAGRAKVAQLLLTFFKTDPNAKGWFLKPGGS
jgi:hypothetical protein